MGPVTALSWVCRTCEHNFHNAICNRHGKKQPKQKKPLTVSTRWLQLLADALVPKFWEMRETYTRAFCYKMWPEVKRRGIDESNLNDRVEPGKVKSFVKREGAPKPATKARGIQGSKNLKTQSLFAHITKSIQKACAWAFRHNGLAHQIAKSMGYDYSISFTSGWNPRDHGKWMKQVHKRYGRPYFYERDGKNWDATMNMNHIGQRAHFYRRFDRRYGRFVLDSAKVTGIGGPRGHQLKYKLCGTTKSGHNDTSLGNSITNAAIIFEAAARLGIKSMMVCVMGDDLIMATDEDFDLHALMEAESDLGIIPEAAKFKDVEYVTFISGCYVPIGGGDFCFMPMPGRLLARLFWSTKNVGQKKIQEWRNSVCTGLIGVCGCLPLVGTLLAMHSGKVNTNLLSRDQFYRYKLFSPLTVKVDQDIVDSWFLRRYGFTGNDVHELTTILRSHSHDFCVLTDPRFERMLYLDSLDPVDRFGKVCC